MRGLFASAVVGAMLSAPVLAAPLGVDFIDTVQPDPLLISFLQVMVKAAQARDFAALDGMFADDIEGYSRSLDPTDPWRKLDLSDRDERSGVDLLTGYMVEMGDLPEGGSPVDYRGDLADVLVGLVTNPAEPLGTMAAMGDAVCSPARLGFDAGAVRNFAAEHEAAGGSVAFYPSAVTLHETPDAGAPVSATLAPRTLLIANYQQGQPDGWSMVFASDGTSGWMADRSDNERLSQQHVCFDEVDGDYRIVGFYSYGL